jgi:hypothetical protein
MYAISSRRALLAGAPAVAAAALASGTVANAVAIGIANADGLDWPGIIVRAEGVIDRLRKEYGPEWTTADQEAADGMLKFCRDRRSPDDEIEWKATLKFFHLYNQSLDWVICGDPVTMIAAMAARSPRGAPGSAAQIDPIFAVIAQHRAANVELEAAIQAAPHPASTRMT